MLSVVLAGWGSNNKYALLGGFRAVAQLISYEVPMVISLLIPVMLTGSLGVNDIVKSPERPIPDLRAGGGADLFHHLGGRIGPVAF